MAATEPTPHEFPTVERSVISRRYSLDSAPLPHVSTARSWKRWSKHSMLEAEFTIRRVIARPNGWGDPSRLSSFLLVPPALEAAADVLYNSLEVRDTTASTKYGTHNPFKGRFKPVMSSYLSSSILTGNSSTAWYLLVDPRDLATIEVVFLNGVEIPTVEQADLDLNVLGIQIRGIHDFGVEKQEYRGSVKSKGAA